VGDDWKSLVLVVLSIVSLALEAAQGGMSPKQVEKPIADDSTVTLGKGM